MDHDRFDGLARSVGSALSRRAFAGTLSATGLGTLAGAAAFDDVNARKKGKKRKHKKRAHKATPNEFGCLEVNDPCASGEQCCSGICENKKCRAHDTGTCDQTLAKEICLAATVEDVVLLRCDNDPNCACHRTTSGSRYCASLLLNEGDPRCADCKTDADCVALGFPTAAACAPVSRGLCAGACPTGMACLIPCGTELPQPD